MIYNLWKHCYLIGSLALLEALAANISTTETFVGGTPPCDALLAAGLGDRVLSPTDSGYEKQVQTWWARNAQLHPWCIVLPESTEEVSLTLTTLLKAGNGAGDWHIAVRSGGHGFQLNNNIQNGVTIDLSMLNYSRYDAETNTATLGSGGRWENVYASLGDQGVVVVGGRDGDVGVGGFLLGGGTSYFSPKYGFACDSVLNYEVVLTNGSVVNANKTSNSDLWKALKGGGSNFGIVTRFDLEALPARDIHYEVRILPATASDVVSDTLIKFADHDMSLADNALVTFLQYNGTAGPDITITAIYVNTAGHNGVETAFDNVRDIPSIRNVSVKQSVAKTAAGSKVQGGQLSAAATLLFQNDPEILQYSTKLHEDFVKSLQSSIGPEAFGTMIFLQPVGMDHGNIAKQRGGNMLGLERLKSNAIMWTGGVYVLTNDADFAVAEACLTSMSDKIQRFAKSVGGDMDLAYLNYASPRQDAIAGYGPQNVEFIREVAAKYDPSGAFQTRVPGGFKIGRSG
ncbi:FAD binding domain-containing protein [Colletotrichum tamarilloi]|uniref:FAD binding domain-containing protein n=1 Tax=Colletotrichum tamarilloi TaxID=1209934 RepID=A0ABQ9QLK3_9PEZI|nr:FAD binding domain-containing protein [Colletotrichum tamarilloi]KAK1476664.1 FAD binding domain-containing protein [Colletotrichum tamarilloi]